MSLSVSKNTVVSLITIQHFPLFPAVLEVTSFEKALSEFLEIWQVV